MYLAEIVDQYSSGLIAYPIILLDIALFCELIGAAGKSINGDFTNGLKIKALKTVAEGIKYLNLNSKKVNVKKNSQCIEEMLVKTAHFQDQISVNRLQIRDILQSNDSTLEFEQYSLQKVDFSELVRESQFRLNLVKSQFKQEKGIWRGIPVKDDEFKTFKTEETDLITSLLAEEKCYVDLLNECQALKKLQIGQQLIVSLPQMTTYENNEIELSRYVQSILTT